jgi:hypothetical protein
MNEITVLLYKGTELVSSLGLWSCIKNPHAIARHCWFGPTGELFNENPEEYNIVVPLN